MSKKQISERKRKKRIGLGRPAESAPEAVASAEAVAFDAEQEFQRIVGEEMASGAISRNVAICLGASPAVTPFDQSSSIDRNEARRCRTRIMAQIEGARQRRESGSKMSWGGGW